MGIKIDGRTVQETDIEWAVRHDDGTMTVCEDEGEADFLMSLGAVEKLGQEWYGFGFTVMP